MNIHRWLTFVALAFLASGNLMPEATGQELRLSAQADIALKPALVRVADLNGDGIDEVLVVTTDGAVKTIHARGVEGDKLKSDMSGELILDTPNSCLLSLCNLEGDERPELVVANRKGLFSYSADAKGVFRGPGQPIAPTRGRGRARFQLRTGIPMWSDLGQDVNGDGYLDVVLPSEEHCELWLHPGAVDHDGPLMLKRAARLAVRVRRSMNWAAHKLSDVHESTFILPRLSVRDVNGDRRKDVMVVDRRNYAWHLQDKDGKIPPTPSVAIDLGIFRDTTPEGGLRPGRTLAGGGRQRFMSRDLNGDGIEDAVIAHRRKVWVFAGTADGPQFTKPSQILKAADDVTALLLLNLDDDKLPDLVILKVLVPSVGTLLLSTLGALEVEVSAVGYRAAGENKFEPKPQWRSELSIRLPSIVSIVKDPYAIISRFESAGTKGAPVVQVDIDGDGRLDVVQPDTTDRRLSVWWGKTNPPAQDAGDLDAVLRMLLFDDKNKTWDLDRIVEWVGKMSESERVRRTGPRDADYVLDLNEEGAMRGAWGARGPNGASGIFVVIEKVGGAAKLLWITKG